MRDFILLRGIQGSGKSTFIEENDMLIPYTISSDSVRLLFQSPEIDPFDNHFKISQNNDRKVWSFIKERISERMQRGELIILDAMNIDVSKWIDMAKYYSYNLHVLNFDVPLEECIERNKNRESYKYVPEDIIRSCYERITNSNIPKDVRVFKNQQEFISLFINGYDSFMDINDKEKVIFFGDIHGCFNPLEKYFAENPFSSKNYYVFCGDYLDRGIQNKETLEFLMFLSTYDNVCFIEGNHNWERFYVNNQTDHIKSNEFLNNTIPQIKSIDKNRIKDFISKWKLYAELDFNGKQFFVSHAGFGKYPIRKKLIPAKSFLKGDKYSDDVDKWWEEHNRWDVIQIHGHRNQYNYPMEQFEHSINMCEYVEYGDCLRVVEFDKNGNRKFLRYKNDVYRTNVNPWKQDKEKEEIITERLSVFSV